MSIDREQALDFLERYRTCWEAWDLEGFLGLFTEDAVYFEHPVDETLVGREELGRYFRREQREGGEATVRMGRPMVEGDQLVAEFWVTMIRGEQDATLSGCFFARLDPARGGCTFYRQYWHEFAGRIEPFDNWGT
ncbi:MAG: nuclear transport factor 2 family protein [Solirubrobacterales bacterium]